MATPYLSRFRWAAARRSNDFAHLARPNAVGRSRGKGWVLAGVGLVGIFAVAGFSIHIEPYVIPLSNAEIDRMVPAELRAPEPSTGQVLANAKLNDISQKISQTPGLDVDWSFPSPRPKVRASLASVGSRSDGILESVRTLGDTPGPYVATAVQANDTYQLYKVLTMRMSDAAVKGDRRRFHETSSVLFRLIRFAMNAEMSTSQASIWRSNFWFLFTYLDKILDQGLFEAPDLRDAIKLMPSDRDVIEFDKRVLIRSFETGVVERLRPTNVQTLAHPPGPILPNTGAYYYAGALDVRAQLRTEIETNSIRLRNLSGTFVGRDRRAYMAEADVSRVLRSIPWAVKGESPAITTAKRSWFRFKRAVTPNGLGRMLDLTYWCANDDEQAFTMRAHVAVLRAKMAALLFRRVHHAPPKRLEDLVSVGLSVAELTDPMTGRPLRFDFARGLVWSIGTDGTDNHGQMTSSFATPDLALKF